MTGDETFWLRGKGKAMDLDDPVLRLEARLAAAYTEQRARRRRARLKEVDEQVRQALANPDPLAAIVQTLELKLQRLLIELEDLS